MLESLSNFNIEVHNLVNPKEIIRFVQVCQTSWPLTESAFLFPIPYKPRVIAQANPSLQFPFLSYHLLCLFIIILWYIPF